MASNIQISATLGTWFASSPIVIGVTLPKNYITGTDNKRRTMRLLTLRVYKDSVNVNNRYEKIEWEPDDDTVKDVTYRQDIQSAVRALLQRVEFDPNTAMPDTLPMVKFAVTVGASWLINGDVHDEFETNQFVTFSGNMYAINGALTDMERLLMPEGQYGLSYARDITLSRKPMGEVVAKGSTYVCYTLPKTSDTLTMEQTAPAKSTKVINSQEDADTLGRGMFVTTEHNMRQFLFVNNLGAIESVCAHTMESASYNVETESYKRDSSLSFTPDTMGNRLVLQKSSPYTSFEMSSGNVTKEWASWWATEFLTASRWWLLEGGKWIPCTVEPKSKNTSMYDNSKADALHVDFSVTLGFSGSTSLSIF